MTKTQLHNLFQQLKNENRGGAPREDWVASTKDVLLMQMRNSTNAKKTLPIHARARHFLHIFFPADGLALAGRALGIFLLVLGTALGGGLASAQVYRDSLPGEFLYDVKLSVEKTQLFLSPSQEYRERLHAEFADRRLEELAKIVEGAAHEGDTRPLALLGAFEGELHSLETGLAELRGGNADVVLDVAKLLERKAGSYQESLHKLARLSSPADRSALIMASDLADGLTVKAVAVIVEKHIQGNASASVAVVVSKIQDRIVQAEVKLDSVGDGDQSQQTVVTKARTAIMEAKELIKEEQYEAALSKIVEVAELTKQAEGDEAAEQTPAPVSPTPAAPTSGTATPEESPAPTLSPSQKEGDAAGSGSR